MQAAYTQAHRDEYGVGDNLIRLAIGIEEVDDLIEDLERGLTAALAHRATPLKRCRGPHSFGALKPYPSNRPGAITIGGIRAELS